MSVKLFIQVACVHSCTPRGRRVHSCSRGFIQAPLGVLDFIGFGIGSLWRSLGLPGPLGFAWVHSFTPSGRRVDCCWRGFNREYLTVDVFIRVCAVLIRRTLRVVRFTHVLIGSLRRAKWFA